MKAMILCGGRGTRLREYTETRPKPMVEVGGRPILWHIMKLYARAGITDFVLCLGYRGDMIRRYFLDYEAMSRDVTVTLGQSPGVELHGGVHGEAGWRVTLVDTGESAQTGARILRASRYLTEGETFALTYGDGVSDVDLLALRAFHEREGRTATVTGVRPPGRFGELRHDHGRVTAFAEKPQVTEGRINGGFFFVEPRFLRYLVDEDDCILEGRPLSACVEDGELSVYPHDGYWQCMDTLRDWEALDRAWREGRAPWRVW